MCNLTGEYFVVPMFLTFSPKIIQEIIFVDMEVNRGLPLFTSMEYSLKLGYTDLELDLGCEESTFIQPLY